MLGSKNIVGIKQEKIVTPSADNSNHWQNLPPDMMSIFFSILPTRNAFNLGTTDKSTLNVFCKLVVGHMNFVAILARREAQLTQEIKNSFLESFKRKTTSIFSDLETVEKEENDRVSGKVSKILSSEMHILNNLSIEDKYYHFPDERGTFIACGDKFGLQFLRSERLGGPLMIEKLSTGKFNLAQARQQRDDTLKAIQLIFDAPINFSHEDLLNSKGIQMFIIEGSITTDQVKQLTPYARTILREEFYHKCLYPHPNAVKELINSRSPRSLNSSTNSFNLFCETLTDNYWLYANLLSKKITPQQSIHSYVYNNSLLFPFKEEWIQDAISYKYLTATQVTQLNGHKIAILNKCPTLRNAVFENANSMELFMNLDAKRDEQMTTHSIQVGLECVFKSGKLSPHTFLKLPYERAEYFFLKPIQKAYAEEAPFTENELFSLSDGDFVQKMQTIHCSFNDKKEECIVQ